MNTTEILSKTMKTLALNLSLIALASTGATAEAALKNVTFQGTVAAVNDSSLQLDGSITNGAPVKGFYIFDPAATDSNPDSTVGAYRTANSTCGIIVQIGNYVFRTNPRKVDLLIELVNRETDSHLVRSYFNLANQPIPIDHIAWQIDDPTGTALTSVEPPLTPPNLANFQSLSGLTVTGGGAEPINGFFIRAHITAIEEAPHIIPERPETTIDGAVAVSWPSRLGYFYQIQKSDDNFETWTDLGEPVLGDGTVLTRFFPRAKGKTAFYRAEIANFPH